MFNVRSGKGGYVWVWLVFHARKKKWRVVKCGGDKDVVLSWLGRRKEKKEHESNKRKCRVVGIAMVSRRNTRKERKTPYVLVVFGFESSRTHKVNEKKM